MAVASLVLTLGTLVHYFSLLPKGKIGPKIGRWVFQLVSGLALATSALVWGYKKSSLGGVVVAPAAAATMFSSMLLYLFSLRKTPIGDIKVKVGDKLLAFTATTSEGVPFDTSELADRRILLKFFRGGW